MITSNLLPDRAAHWHTFDARDADSQVIGAAEECQRGNVMGQPSRSEAADDILKHAGPSVFVLLTNKHRGVTRHDPVVDSGIFAGRQGLEEFRAWYHLIERHVDMRILIRTAEVDQQERESLAAFIGRKEARMTRAERGRRCGRIPHTMQRWADEAVDAA